VTVDVEGKGTLENDGDEGAKAEEVAAKVANRAVESVILTIVKIFVVVVDYL